MDSSWQITWNETSILLDPWLIGSEIDGFSWFNEQWHHTPPVSPKKLDKYDAILVSQSYTDHCHQQTLLELDHSVTLGTPTAVKRLTRELPQAEIRTVPDLLSGEVREVGAMRISYLDPGRKMDPIYYGIVISHGKEAIVYSPHGFALTDKQLGALKDLDIRLLITSFSTFKLPFFLGGAVNPGKENAMALVRSLNPDKVMHTHDENKHAKGLIKRIAKTKYPDFSEIGKELQDRFMYLDERYIPVSL